VRAYRTTNSQLTGVSRWRSWLHASVDDDVAATRHGVLICLLLAAAALTATACITVVLSSGLSVATAAASLFCIAVPLAIAAFLAYTGRLDAAHVQFSVHLAVLVVVATGLSDGSASFTIVWLVLLPLIALLSGQIRTIAISGGLALTALFTIQAAGMLALTPAPMISQAELAALDGIANTGALIFAGLIVAAIVLIEHAARRLLAHARDEAERASRAKSAFLATVSHELRTPLTAIIGYSDLLRRQQPTDTSPRLEHVRLIRENGEHLLDLITNMIDASQIETGSFTISPEPTAIGEVISAVISSTAPLAKRLKLAIEVDPVLPDVMVDPRAARRILLNLLSNAIKFTPDSGLVTLSARGRGSLVEIAVSDTGAGIAAEHLPHLGRPFYQVDTSYARTNDGAGLGLAIVRGLAELHGGGLRVESRQGVGSRFIVTLPAALEAPKERTGRDLPYTANPVVSHTAAARTAAASLGVAAGR
jgi:signal transduction histidine kinase